MLKRLAVLTTLVCGLAGTAAAQSCEPKLGHPPLVRKGYMIAAINPTVAPIQYMNEDGEIVGLDVDFGNAIAKKLCLKMEWHSTQFATMIPILKEHRIDLINSFMVYTPERAEQVLMIPYGATSGSVIVGKNNTDKIDGLEYFSGKFLATELGTIDYRDAKAVSDELVKAGKPPIDLHTFGTYADVLQAVVSGQAEGGMLGIEQSVYFRKKGAAFRLAIGGMEPHAEALAFSNRELADAVAQVMNEMKADGSLDKIFEPYGHCLLPGPYKVTAGPEPTFTCPPRKD